MIEQRLDRVMKSRGFQTAYKLAKVTGLTEEGLKKILGGQTKGISFDTLDRLCEVLKCKPGDLLIHINPVERKSKKK